MMRSDGGIDQIAAETAKAREGSVLVGAGKPAVADDVGHQDRHEFAGFADRAPLGVATLAQIPTQKSACFGGGGEHSLTLAGTTSTMRS